MQSLKIGDLVIWTNAGNKYFGDYYSNNYKAPGIIIEVNKKHKVHDHSFGIYWADGKTTTEHACYIERIEK